MSADSLVSKMHKWVQFITVLMPAITPNCTTNASSRPWSRNSVDTRQRYSLDLPRLVVKDSPFIGEGIARVPSRQWQRHSEEDSVFLRLDSRFGLMTLEASR